MVSTWLPAATGAACPLIDVYERARKPLPQIWDKSPSRQFIWVDNDVRECPVMIGLSWFPGPIPGKGDGGYHDLFRLQMGIGSTVPEPYVLHGEFVLGKINGRGLGGVGL